MIYVNMLGFLYMMFIYQKNLIIGSELSVMILKKFEVLINLSIPNLGCINF